MANSLPLTLRNLGGLRPPWKLSWLETNFPLAMKLKRCASMKWQRGGSNVRSGHAELKSVIHIPQRFLLVSAPSPERRRAFTKGHANSARSSRICHVGKPLTFLNSALTALKGNWWMENRGLRLLVLIARCAERARRRRR